MMNLIYGEVVGLNECDPMKMARIKIGGAIKEVSLGLLTGVRIGDRVLLCDGVAIGKVTDAVAANENHVSCDSR
jgi:hydrogenase maturation factor